MLGFKFLGNTRVPHYKDTENMPAVRIKPSEEVLILMSQHIGAPAKPVVKVGDEVLVGQLIAEAVGNVSAPIYSSVSGKVVAIEEHITHMGTNDEAIRIKSDGLMTLCDGIEPPTVNNIDEFCEAIRKSGVVGLGGAGFPTAVKASALKSGNIDTVLINGSECEPYLTCDARTMIDDAMWVVKGVQLISELAPSVKSFVIGIEDNKPECIEKMTEVFADKDYVNVVKLPTKYPQGAEKVLIHNTLKRVVPEGKLPADIGVLVFNVSTVAFIAKYIETGMPLVEKAMTVSGNAVNEPKNVIAPIGMSARDVLEAAGGVKEDLGKVVFGGPMTGYAISTLDEPVIKTTGGIIAFTKKESKEPKNTSCIHCGRCLAACPHKLNLVKYSDALKLNDIEEKMHMLEENKILLCMECGCCSYVCPARRPLIQNNRLAKAEYKKYKAHQATLKK